MISSEGNVKGGVTLGKEGCVYGVYNGGGWGLGGFKGDMAVGECG